MSATVTLHGVALAANAPIAWRFLTGTAPYSTVLTVHRDDWGYLRDTMGNEGDLRIKNTAGAEATIRGVTILHQVGSDSPNRVSFVVADRRWKWNYKLIARDYNVPRRTGDTTAVADVPYEGSVTVDEYDFKRYSLKPDGTRWDAREAVEDVLAALVGKGGYIIESWPLKPKGQGELPLQNVMLRDSGDTALARLLSYVPGAECYVDSDGKVRIIDGADLNGARRKLKSDLPPSTWDGDAAAFIDRKRIRPKRVIVHYQREVEALFEYQDDFGPTVTPPDPDTLYVENVIPTAEPVTEFEEYDPIAKETVTRKVGAGTWVEVREWLRKMNELRPSGGFEWVFKTLSIHWQDGGLDAVLGVPTDGSTDESEFQNLAARVSVLKQHFRQSFRINRRVTERLRDILPHRAGTLDTVTGRRALSAVWAETCIIPTDKGKRVASRTSSEKGAVLRNIYLPTVNDGETIADKPQGPALVDVLDSDVGLYRLDWMTSPYGTIASFLPGNLVDQSGSFTVPTRDMAEQMRSPMGFAMQPEGMAKGVYLRDRWAHKALMTIVPAAPNNKYQFLRVPVEADDVAESYRNEYGIRNGEGPDLEIFASPSEMTARYQWRDDTKCKATLTKLLGLDSDDPETAGIGDDDPNTPDIDESELDGFTLVNAGRELRDHAKSMAAEALAGFADAWQGRVATAMEDGNIRLAGGQTATTIAVSAYPSAKVSLLHDFQGQQRPISRFALFPQSVRELVLGILPYRKQS